MQRSAKCGAATLASDMVGVEFGTEMIKMKQKLFKLKVLMYK